MKIKAAIGALLLASACAAVPADENVPVHGATGYTCDAPKGQRLIGEAARAELGAEALRLTGARTLRWIRPGDMVTADFREDRVNVELDADNRVNRIRCG